MKFTILTLFPDMLTPYLEQSIIGRAIKNGAIEVVVRNLRDWADSDAHRSVDGSPYGGGPGMVLRVDVIDRALADLKAESSKLKAVLLTPQGQRFVQQTAETLAADANDLILICGHYEGFDERVRSLVDIQLSLGDFVLTGGELPALAIVDAVARLLPDVLGKDSSAHEESFSIIDQADQSTRESFDPAHPDEEPFDHPSPKGYGVAGSGQGDQRRLIEYPHYTRPDIYTPISKDLGELAVPDEIKSGNHAAIKAWRLQQARNRTRKNTLSS